MRLWRLATVSAVTLAGLAVLASGAQAKGWNLTVRPAQVTPGGSVNIKTTAGRKCALTIRLGGTNFHYRLPRGGERFTLSPSTPLGKGRVTVSCKGLVATVKLTVIHSAATQSAPTSSTPPPTSPAPPPASPPTNTQPAMSQTPITVANVCGLNPGLGTVHYMTSSQGWPTAYWTDGSGSKLTLLAASDDGDNKVDFAVVVGSDGQSIAYFAYCNWSSWLTVAQWEAIQAQQGVSNSQASSLGYLLQEQTDNAIFEENQDWFVPAAGWQECPDNPYDWCDYEPEDG